MGTSTAGADVTEAAYKHFVQQGTLPEGYDLWRHHTYGAILEVVRQLTGAEGPAWMHSTACNLEREALGVRTTFESAPGFSTQRSSAGSTRFAR